MTNGTTINTILRKMYSVNTIINLLLHATITEKIMYYSCIFRDKQLMTVD